MALTVAVLSKIPHLLKELTKALPNITFHEVSTSDPRLKQSEIVICDFDLLAPHLYDLPAAKWVQGTWAGVDKLLPVVDPSKPPPYPITRFTGEHFGRLMGEYVVASIVNHERDFFKVKRAQEERRWAREGKISNHRAIFDLTVGVLGLGNIGMRIGRTLHFLGARVLAFGRRATLPAEYSYVEEYHTKATLASFLKDCDYVINVLPNTPETSCLLDNDVLENCADRRSVFVNIGRSNVVSESSLIKALDNNWLSAVILDVFDTEPLPKDNPLWTKEQVFITPHVAGLSRARDIAQQFATNFRLYENNSPLPALVDFTKGY